MPFACANVLPVLRVRQPETLAAMLFTPCWGFHNLEVILVRLIRIMYWRPSYDTTLLLYRISKIFLTALGLSALIHLLLLALAPKLLNGPNGNLPEPAHVKFFSRHDPQLTRPIELRKLPLPKRQPIQREVHLAATHRPQAPVVGAFSTLGHVRQLSLPNPTLTIDPIGVEDVGPILGPTISTGENPVGITRYAANQVDLHLNLLDINSLDIGRYQAMVVQDPDDRQGIKGFVKFGMAMSNRAFHTTEYLEAEGLLVKTTTTLVKALSDFTGLHAEVVREVRQRPTISVTSGVHFLGRIS